MKTLRIEKDAQKMLDKLDKHTYKRIFVALRGLLEEPPLGDIKPLKGELHGWFRLRIGGWRAEYEIINQTVCVHRVSSRGSAY
ncbi:MAG: type II toxin-antitoxin system RelE/ParE family toxin [Defluviitaleaceae bacterium]|nr:type II toxin-antitoxin system RelE/ParE family toxin [Defluviitaleaceae bacterium]